ncbi:hypothetical protein [Streptomyces sp. MNP-20]|uniref:DUF7848 domain-containing protein n=1 Tax=Streptomyces sp. MNP-20 TaxID=2721165 RepID=UPI001556685B|nr:hypothetical protein [Streptomyces sp. MNP-20]
MADSLTAQVIALQEEIDRHLAVLRGEERMLDHLQVGPAHLDYREHHTRPYRAVPGDWQ